MTRTMKKEDTMHDPNDKNLPWGLQLGSQSVHPIDRRRERNTITNRRKRESRRK